MSGHAVARDILESYAAAEFFTKLPDIDEEIKVVTYIAAEGDISTDLLSPGNQAHSRSDRELHGKCMISESAQKEIEALKLQHPDKRVMLIAEKGTMGVGSSRMSGVNNVAYGPARKPAPMCLCQYCADCCRHKRHFADFLDHGRRDRRHWGRFEKLG